ncbi:MAG: YmdB family metallophosphoesterase [Hyphomicrobiales bacterium]|nr:YmdB family metallophosphoesterase [Hyphomicrobiales bacterium]
MRLLFVGDVVGRAGRAAFVREIPRLRARWALDLVVVNGENAAGGFGITEPILDELLDAGADRVTLGNHAFDQREAMVFIERRNELIRPVTFPPGTPGRGADLVETKTGKRALVVNAMGRIFMDAMEDPFAAVARELDACPLGVACDAAIVDFHAEATSEKLALAYHLDGRASLVVGTHTHVPTADARILPEGTAFQCDAGMTGDFESVIGMDREEPIRKFLHKTPGARMTPAEGPATLCGVAVETGADGKAVKVAPVRIGGALSPATADFWEPA